MAFHLRTYVWNFGATPCRQMHAMSVIRVAVVLDAPRGGDKSIIKAFHSCLLFFEFPGAVLLTIGMGLSTLSILGSRKVLFKVCQVSLRMPSPHLPRWPWVSSFLHRALCSTLLCTHDSAARQEQHLSHDAMPVSVSQLMMPLAACYGRGILCSAILCSLGR